MDGYYRSPYSALIHRCSIYFDNNIPTVYARTVHSDFEDLNFTALNDGFNLWIRNAIDPELVTVSNVDIVPNVGLPLTFCRIAYPPLSPEIVDKLDNHFSSKLD